jgi:hypothetical protein
VPLILREVWRMVAVPALPDMEPVIVPATVRAPRLAEAEKRLVEEAVVAKKLVDVAEVEVERVMLLNMVAPVKVFRSARSVEEAAVAPPQPVQEVTVSAPMVAAAE